MKNHKAMTQETLIAVIIIVISFIILGYAALRITGIIGPTFSKETCHSSVVLRGSSSIIKNLGFFPGLKCKTEYKCLSMGGKCPPNYETIPVANEDDIKRELANAMYDCWWQLGEGKINFLGKTFLTQQTCLFCSQIAFDDKIKKNYPLINGFSEYLSTTSIPNTAMSYSTYFFSSSTIPDIQIDTSKDYVTNFRVIKQGTLAKNTGNLASIVGAGAIVVTTLITGGLTLGVYVTVTTLGVGVIGYSGIGILHEGAGDVGDIIFSLVPFTPESLTQCQNIESVP